MSKIVEESRIEERKEQNTTPKQATPSVPQTPKKINSQNPARPRKRKEYDLSTFMGRLAKSRSDKGFTQEKLAELINVSSGSVISKYENGFSIPDMPTFADICKKLEVSADYILFGKNVTSSTSILTRDEEDVIIALSNKIQTFRNGK